MSIHQYVERPTGRVMTEKLVADRLVRLLYSPARECAPFLFDQLVSPRMSAVLSVWNFDWPMTGNRLEALVQGGLNPAECLDEPSSWQNLRQAFERRICFWDCRPMVDDDGAIVAPSDSCVLIGGEEDALRLPIKDKPFSTEELLGRDKHWHSCFSTGPFAVFRLTPEKYHHNHSPVSGIVRDIYPIDGLNHACNPVVNTRVASPLSKNERVVTIIDTDVPEGSCVGLVAMVEVTALMIGEIVQVYSDFRYERPRPVERGMIVRRGAVKSLFRPGSSTVVLLFAPNRVRFCDDLVANSKRCDVETRYTSKDGSPWVETEVRVRSTIGFRTGPVVSDCLKEA